MTRKVLTIPVKKLKAIKCMHIDIFSNYEHVKKKEDTIEQ